MRRFFYFTYATFLFLLSQAALSAQPATPEPAPKKFALLVGIDAYKNNLTPLEGCAKDAKDMQDVLTKMYKFPSVHLLVNEAATRARILAELSAQEAQAQRGDLFVFYFSGHGALFPDNKSEDRDETKEIIPPDGKLKKGKYDSALCPVDTGSSAPSGKPWRNLILDDELHAYFARFTQKGCAVVFIADSCHSGTIGKGPLKVIRKSLDLEDALGLKFDEIPLPEFARDIKPPEMRGQYLIFSSSQDNQYSGATEIGSLFTNALIETLRLNPKRNYKDIYEVVRRKVKKISEDTQDPNLDTRFYRGSMEASFLSFLEFAATTTGNTTETGTPLTFNFLVTDANDQPISSAAITLNHVNKPGIEYSCRTTRRGSGTIQKQSPGTYRITIRHPKYMTVDKTVEVSESPFNQGQADLFIRLKSK